MRRKAAHEHHIAAHALQGDGFRLGHGLGGNGGAAGRQMPEIAGFDEPGQDLQAAGLYRGFGQRQPAGDHVGAFGFGHHHAGVLVPRRVVERGAFAVFVGLRRFGSQVLNGVAGQFGTQERFEEVEQVFVEQEFEHRPPPIVHDVHSAPDLRALFEQQAVARGKRGVRVQVRYFALLVQRPRPLVDPRRQLVDCRLQVVVGKRRPGDDDTAGVEFCDLLCCQSHLF